MSTYPVTSSLPQNASIISRWLLDEASGNRADSVGSNTLTDNNTVAAGTGLSVTNATFDNSADFERANSEYLSITDASQSGLDITSDLSFFGWVKVETAPSTEFFIIASKYTLSPSTSIAWEFYYRDNAGAKTLNFLMTTDGSTGESKSVTQALTAGTWYHVGFSYDASAGSVTFYLDGAKVGATQTGLSTSIHNSTAPFILGATRANSPTNFWDGLMQDAIIWNTALTDEEVFNLYYTYSAQNVFHPSSDGWAGRQGSDETWANIRGGNGTIHRDQGTSTVENVHLRCSSNASLPFNLMRRGLFTFDTSSLPDSATITSAKLRLYIFNNKIDTLSQSLTLTEAVTGDSDIVDSDYQGNVSETTVYGDTIALSAITVETYQEWDLNATGIAAINKTGFTDLGLHFESERSNSAPTFSSGAESRLGWHFGSNASNKPQLVIAYTTGIELDLTETITVADSISKSMSRTLTDVITVVDDFVSQLILSLNLTETIRVVDSIAKSISRSISESIAVADSVVKMVARSISEAIAVTDNITTQRVINKVLTEVISVKDSIVKRLNGILAIFTREPRLSNSFTKEERLSNSHTKEPRLSNTFTKEPLNKD